MRYRVLRWVFPVAVGATAVACGAAADDALNGGAGHCPDNGSTLRLSVVPGTLIRNDPVLIEVEWALTLELEEPVSATMGAGDGMIEVDVPLLRDPSQSESTYVGSLTNPFGAGAPPGSVSVLATAAIASSCQVAPTAATSFVLE